MHYWYRLFDKKDDPRVQEGANVISRDEATTWNKNGYGIFWSLNQFNSPTRTIQNLKSISAWAIDMDEGTKEEMAERIRSGLPPTMIVETKRGFQVYFKAKDPKVQHWNSIVLDRLVPFYSADRRARDMARILRVPGYFHMKDPSSPFLIEKVWNRNIDYTEADIAKFYPDQSAPEREEFIKKQNQETPECGSVWEEIWYLDCEEALLRISGTDAVGGEVFTLRPNRSGTKNIWVNGKSTSSWIDINGRIGSLSDGGPTIFAWVDWYHRNKKRTVGYLRKYFPELSWDEKNGTSKI